MIDYNYQYHPRGLKLNTNILETCLWIVGYQVV